MINIMAIDFEKAFYENITRRFDDLDKQMDEHNRRHEADLSDIHEEMKINTQVTERVLEQATKTNGRVNGHDRDILEIKKVIKSLGRKRVELPQVDSRVLSLIAIAAIIVLVIIAVKTGAGDEVVEIIKP